MPHHAYAVHMLVCIERVCVCVCVELLFLRILRIFQRLAAENCRGPVLSLGVTGQRRHPQGGVKTYLLAGSLFRDASKSS